MLVWLDVKRQRLAARAIQGAHELRWFRLREYVSMVAVFCLAFTVRIIFNKTVAAGYQPMFDAVIYNELARSLVHQHCYCFPQQHVPVYRPPLWPMVMAAIYAVLGDATRYARLACCVLGSGTCVLVYLIAKDLFGRRIALVTGIIAAVYAGMFIWDGWLYTESLYIFLQTAFLFFLMRMQRDSRRVWIVLCGVSLALAALARPTGTLLLGLLVLCGLFALLFKLAPWRRVVVSTALVAALAFALMLPWTLYTSRVTHSPLPPSNVYKTLAGSYNDTVDHPGDILYGLWSLWSGDDSDFHDHTVADEQALGQRTLSWIEEHPEQTRALLGIHLVHMWTPWATAYEGHPFAQYPDRPSTVFVRDGLLPVMSYIVFLLAALGLVVTWRRKWRYLLPVYLTIGLTILENVAFYGSPRFRAPIEPLLVLLVGGFLWWVSGVYREAHMQRARLQPPSEAIEAGMGGELG